MNANSASTSLQEILEVLTPERKGALLDYALYLREQDEREKILVKEDEDGWDSRFTDKASFGRFQEWGRQALAEPGAERFITLQRT